LAKRLSEENKKNIVKSFTSGNNLKQLAEEFSCTKATIVRNLKKYLGDKRVKEIIDNDKNDNKVISKKEDKKEIHNVNNLFEQKNISENYEEDYFSTSFMEIAPLDYEIDNDQQKDLASLPISDIDFPKIVYMVVDKKIELEIKLLKEYPDWQFLSQDELNRKTIEIHDDLKQAKRVCNKEQKVIKVPNTDVFKLVAPILLSRGISRIIISNKLIAL
tara:strand:+ start:2695 stop:3345 length:651 start_codon:yes stop_codon:yes gene_type:complete